MEIGYSEWNIFKHFFIGGKNTFEIRTSYESIFTNKKDTIRDGHTFQLFTSSESIFINERYAFWQFYNFQTFTLSESSAINSSDTIWNEYFSQISSPTEVFFFNDSHSGRNDSLDRCRGNLKHIVFTWKCRPKPKYNEQPYVTELVCRVCQYHYSNKLEGKKLETIGYDEWDAIDGIAAEYN